MLQPRKKLPTTIKMYAHDREFAAQLGGGMTQGVELALQLARNTIERANQGDKSAIELLNSIALQNDSKSA